MKQEKIELSGEFKLRLQTAMANGTPLKQIAANEGICLDTLRRYLVKLGLADYSSERFQPPRPRPKHWHRPCMICKSERPRPVGQYICSSCKESRDETGINPYFDYPDTL